MTKIGLLGGMSYHSTIDYYRRINDAVAQARGGHASAEIVLESVDFEVVRRQQLAGDWAGAGRLLGDAARRLQDAGADVVALCTNLMHKVAPAIESAIDVPFLHIADAVAERAAEDGWTRLGLIGTDWVMAETFYADRLAGHGIEVVVPEETDRKEVDRVIWEELTLGVVEEASRSAYVAIIDRLAEQGAQAVVLACTEIQLLVDERLTDVPLLDSTAAHTAALGRLATMTAVGG